jgi:hypothetical protein
MLNKWKYYYVMLIAYSIATIVRYQHIIHLVVHVIAPTVYRLLYVDNAYLRNCLTRLKWAVCGIDGKSLI